MFRVSGVFRDLEQLDFVLAFQLVFYLVQKGIPYAAALRNTSDIVLYNPNPVLKLGRGGDDDDDKGNSFTWTLSLGWSIVGWAWDRPATYKAPMTVG
jgi:hypothetical protein